MISFGGHAGTIIEPGNTGCGDRRYDRFRERPGPPGAAALGAVPPRPGASSRSPHQPLRSLMAPIPPAIRVSRAPGLTLWATVVAERLGHPPETALTLGRFVGGSSARVRTRAPRSHPGNIRQLGMRSSQHRPVREPRSTRVRIFVLPSSWTPL